MKMPNLFRRLTAGLAIFSLVFVGFTYFGNTPNAIAAPTTDTFTASGTWDAPTGVTEATVQCWGAGGGGTTNWGGGGGGAYAESTISVTPGNTYTITVGTSASDTSGGSSSFESTVVAAGGLRGGLGGAGGTTALSTGDIEFRGGNGLISGGNAGAGGGAGTTEAGGDAAGAGFGAGGVLYGGDGGDDGSDGSTIGGGGGSAGTSGGSGARGECRITYTASAATDPIKKTWGAGVSAGGALGW